MNIQDYNMAINGAKHNFGGELPEASSDSQASGAGFQDVLRDLVSQVDSLQKNADASIQGLVTGQTTNVHDVTIKMAEAGEAFDLMMQVRNKLLDAYQQIIKMQA